MGNNIHRKYIPLNLSGKQSGYGNEWQEGCFNSQEVGISDGSLYTWRKQPSAQGEGYSQAKANHHKKWGVRFDESSNWD